MKDYKEMANDVFERRKLYLQKKKKRKKGLYYSITSLCIVAVLVISISLPAKPQETLIPQTHSQHHSSISTDSSCTDSDPQIPSFPILNTTKPLPSESIVSSIPQTQFQEETLQQQSSSISTDSIQESKPNQSSSEASNNPPASSNVNPPPTNESKPDESSKVESIPPSSQPELHYKINFSNLNEFSSFLPQLNIEIQRPTYESNTKFPTITTPQPNENFWQDLDGESANKPDEFPEVEAPGDIGVPGDVEAPEEIWQGAKEMFNNGYYCVPYLQNGNKLLYLEQIYIQSDTLKYNYRFHSNISETSNQDLLSVQLYSYSIEYQYNNYLYEYDYKMLSYNDITYTAFRLDEYNYYNTCVIWKQNGFYCRANYKGDDRYLASIIPNLYLLQIPWAI